MKRLTALASVLSAVALATLAVGADGLPDGGVRLALRDHLFGEAPFDPPGNAFSAAVYEIGRAHV